MTAKTFRNKGRIDYTRGVSREQRVKNRREKLESSLLSHGKERISRKQKRLRKLWMAHYKSARAIANFERAQCAMDAQLFGEVLPERDEVSAFEEIPFGNIYASHQKFRNSTNTVDLSSIVVFLALFDGDQMLFVCTGIPLPCKTTTLPLTRFVTSTHLVREFNRYRNKDDKLRVAVRLPDNTVTDGFLGLYDDDIAIVTSLDLLNVHHIDLDFKKTSTSHDYYNLLAVGRSYESGYLMIMHGTSSVQFNNNTWVPRSRCKSKALLGGPLLGYDGRVIAMILDVYDRDDAFARCDGFPRYSFLPLRLLCDRLNHFQILNPKKLDFHGYSLPKGVQSIVPSGFMKTINRIKACGYPIPPPLVLEFNGVLLNRFEQRFGDLLAWKGYPYGCPDTGSMERVWQKLEKRVVRYISRSVVSLSSYKEHVRSFACTGLFIKLEGHGCKAARNVILTSASLVRSHDDGKIDNTLTIDVFLPPNQRGSGTLELYDLNYNIAIVSVKNFKAVCAENICREVQEPSKEDVRKQSFRKRKLVQKPSEKVVPKKPSEEVIAIGRDTIYGPLMASAGQVKHSNKHNKLDCKDLKFSTCKIKKAGIGGPLINFDGSFVGMNFYDASGLTPYLPREKIVEVIRLVNDLPLEWGYGHPIPIPAQRRRTKENRWPVPEPYWYHGELDVDMFDVPELRGRTLN